MDRRQFLSTPLLSMPMHAHGEVAYPRVEAGTPLAFPRDHGSHPAFRIEWWYITGWVQDAQRREFGVQVTFFRSRPGIAETSSSRFAPSQLLFAHAAVADAQAGRLQHDQRAARAGLGLAGASAETTDVHIDDWSLRLDGTTYRAVIAAREFAIELAFVADASLLLQGVRGLSRKGPLPAQASFYYSRPQLAVSGSLALGGTAREVSGKAWLDHEWSSAYLAPDARGWEWTGINLDDGGALMLFRMRNHAGSALWAGGSHRDATGSTRVFQPAEVRWTALRHWRSPRTGVTYPVTFRVQAGGLDILLEPVFDDQELDSRASVGTIYWEGAVRATTGNRQIGRGYLELTGYAAPLRI